MIIHHITELFSRDGREFVIECYRNLLRREPDERGLNYYLGRLAEGHGKASVIAQLALSTECRPHDQINGLKNLIANERRTQHWFFGKFGNRTRALNVLNSSLVSLSRIEQQLQSLRGAELLRSAQLRLDDVSQSHLHEDMRGEKNENFQQCFIIEPEYNEESEEIKLIRESNFFDASFYLESYPDVKASNIDPIVHFHIQGWIEGRNPSSTFSTLYYLSRYPDLREVNTNPFLHYIKYGADEGRICFPFNENMAIDGFIDCERNECDNLPCDFVTDIIIPIYNGFEYLSSLFNSIYKNKAEKYHLIIIEDFSPDKRVINFLEDLPYSYPGMSYTLIRNDTNLGFIKSVNKGVEIARGNFILLNSDTEVPEKWISRLMSPIIQLDNIASTTPFTNAGTIFSFPEYLQDNLIIDNRSVDEVDKHFCKICFNETYIEVPTGVGFCMGINKSLVDKIGFFDEIFGKGYCEENDWCQRAIEAGYRNIHVTNLFVYHKHGGSFNSEEKRVLNEKNSSILATKHPTYFKQVARVVNKDDLAPLRGLLLASLKMDAGVSIIIDHELGGGANEYRNNHIKSNENSALIVVNPLSDLIVINLHINHGDLVGSYCINDISVMPRLVRFLNADKIIVNNLVSYRKVFGVIEAVLRSVNENHGVELITLVHDYFYLCPSYNLLDLSSKYCNVPDNLMECNNCLVNNKHINSQAGYIRVDYPSLTIEDWRNSFQYLLERSTEVRFFSESSKNILYKAFPTLSKGTAIIAPHIVDWLRPVPSHHPRHIINLAVIGSMSFHKGINVVIDLIDHVAKNDLNIVVNFFGNVPESYLQNDSSKYFVKHGHYKKESLPALMINNSIDAVFIPSIWPETFSYTTEEAIKMELPVVVFNYGAPAERVSKYSKGLVLNSSEPKQIIESIIKHLSSLDSYLPCPLKTNHPVKINVHQIYYSESQKEYLADKFIPYYNPPTDKAKIWHETGVFIKEFMAGKIPEIGLTGYVSWRFPEKTGISSEEFLDFIENNPGYDVYFINPFFELADLYRNVWVQGEKHHPGVINLANDVLTKIGVNFDFYQTRNDVNTLSYCNYWVGSCVFWNRYMTFIMGVHDAIVRMPRNEFQRFVDDAGYHTGVGYLTFIMERLFSTFLVMNTDIKSKPYIYSDVQKSSLIANLRQRVGM